jgi:hypothetical protein
MFTTPSTGGRRDYPSEGNFTIEATSATDIKWKKKPTTLHGYKEGASSTNRHSNVREIRPNKCTECEEVSPKLNQ